MKKRVTLTKEEYSNILRKHSKVCTDFFLKLDEASRQDAYNIAGDFLSFYKNFKTEKEKASAVLFIFYMGLDKGVEVGKFLESKKVIYKIGNGEKN